MHHGTDERVLWIPGRPDDERMGFFGIEAAPRELASWHRVTGIPVDIASVTETWDRNSAIRAIYEAEEHEQTAIVVSWEPWVMVPPTVAPTVRGRPQPHWSLDAIIAGDHDDYIRTVARQIKNTSLDTVYLKIMPYFDGLSRPWCGRPDSYISAWKRIVDILFETGADKARPVWCPTLAIDASPALWGSVVTGHWPGRGYVDFAAIDITRTMPDPDTDRDVDDISDLAARATLLWHLVELPLIATGVQTAWGARGAFDSLADWIANTEIDLRGIVLGQPPLSLGNGIGLGDDDLTWNVTGDERVTDAVKRIATSVRRRTA